MTSMQRTISEIAATTVGIMRAIALPRTGIKGVAAVIEFHIPKNFYTPMKRTAAPEGGRIIEFCPQTLA